MIFLFQQNMKRERERKKKHAKTQTTTTSKNLIGENDPINKMSSGEKPPKKKKNKNKTTPTKAKQPRPKTFLLNSFSFPGQNLRKGEHPFKVCIGTAMGGQ